MKTLYAIIALFLFLAGPAAAHHPGEVRFTHIVDHVLFYAGLTIAAAILLYLVNRFTKPKEDSFSRSVLNQTRTNYRGER